jgi:hypothetical protein
VGRHYGLNNPGTHGDPHAFKTVGNFSYSSSRVLTHANVRRRESLQTRKRRIYDVTNVLEGVGLLQKTGTNNVQWKSPHPSSSVGNGRFKEIHQQRLEQLRDLKRRMQETADSLTTCIHNMTSQQHNQRLLYIRRDDLIHIEAFQRCVFVGQGSPGPHCKTLQAHAANRTGSFS